MDLVSDAFFIKVLCYVGNALIGIPVRMSSVDFNECRCKLDNLLLCQFCFFDNFIDFQRMQIIMANMKTKAPPEVNPDTMTTAVSDPSGGFRARSPRLRLRRAWQTPEKGTRSGSFQTRKLSQAAESPVFREIGYQTSTFDNRLQKMRHAGTIIFLPPRHVTEDNRFPV